MPVHRATVARDTGIPVGARAGYLDPGRREAGYRDPGRCIPPVTLPDRGTMGWGSGRYDAVEAILERPTPSVRLHISRPVVGFLGCCNNDDGRSGGTGKRRSAWNASTQPLGIRPPRVPRGPVSLGTCNPDQARRSASTGPPRCARHATGATSRTPDRHTSSTCAGPAARAQDTNNRAPPAVPSAPHCARASPSRSRHRCRRSSPAPADRSSRSRGRRTRPDPGVLGRGRSRARPLGRPTSGSAAARPC